MDLEAIMDQYAIDIILLFGSQARDRATPLSDHDIAIFIDPLEFAQFSLQQHLALANELETVLARTPLNLVTLNDAPIALAYRVLKDAKILAARKFDAYEAFRAKKWMEYFDFEPIERQFTENTLRVGD